MRGGDHLVRATRILCRRWGIPRSDEGRVRRVMGTHSAAYLALALATRDLKLTALDTANKQASLLLDAMMGIRHQ